ncbi:uncharacterized protein LOC130726744 [Lotus japonicus]|uniref:uncharacterized protein LOC130726744 n=1 Tax=Lotus japonicus TaxID=34305 RepID=UPI0025856752|nr:uncharacterized protein LOC130726744 [Lotus japonicus]
MVTPNEFLYSFISPLKILFDSLRILLHNKLLFCSIFLLTTLPLSFLFFTLTISTHSLRYQIYHLQALARVVSTRVESGHVLEESRVNAISLIRTRGVFSLLSFPLSLAASVSAVHATISSFNGKHASVSSAITAVKTTWKRPSVTAIFAYTILFAFSPVPRVLAFVFPAARLPILAVGSVVEVYLMAVMSLGIVVSVAEERLGWEAVTVGSGLMRGRRVCGWVLSGLFVLVSGLINRRVEELLEGEDSISVWDRTVLICWYGLVVLLSYVITTVFYCDSRKRHAIREPQVEEDDDCEGSVLVGSSL